MEKRNRTKYTVLGMLAIAPFTGYEIKKMIQTSTNHFWSESEGQIYPALIQCVQECLATCKEELMKDTRRVKKIYSITAQGKKVLNTWLKKEAQPTLIRNEFLLKLFFGKNATDNDNIHHLRHYQKSLEKEILTYEEIRKKLTTAHKNSPHLKYWLIALDYGFKVAKAELLWCKESLKLFN